MLVASVHTIECDMSDKKTFDVVVRVDYEYENEYGDTRSAWAAWSGELTADAGISPYDLAEYAATHIVTPGMKPPNDTIKRVINTKPITYTVSELT